MLPNRRFALPLFAALALAVLALGIAACGYSSDSKDVVEGEAVELGDLQFTVTFSRYLNPNDNEDSAYLVGQPAPPNGSTYFGVFFEVQNKSEEPQTLPSTLTITDADDETYEVIPSESLYALPLGGEVESQEQIPVLDSTPQQGAIEGSLALFLLPAEASDNRPLTLHIPGANGEDAEVTLDLLSRPFGTARRVGLAKLHSCCAGESHPPRLTDRPRALRPPPGRRLRRPPLRLRSAARRPPASAFSAGAKAANQASLIWTGLSSSSWPGFGPSSAVPVLPATWASAIAPAVPVPSTTTPTISLGQLVGDLLRHHPHRLRVRAQLLAFDDRGRLADAAVGDRLRDAGHLQRRRRHFALADRRDAEVDFFADFGRDRRFGRFDFLRRSATSRGSAAS